MHQHDEFHRLRLEVAYSFPHMESTHVSHMFMYVFSQEGILLSGACPQVVALQIYNVWLHVLVTILQYGLSPINLDGGCTH